MRRACLTALCCVLLLPTGCASFKRAPSPTATPAAVSNPALQPSPAQAVGRVIAIDSRSLSVIVELAPYATPPSDLDKRTLLSRQPDDLRPTARLQPSPYLRGRTLGTTLVAGRPQIGDEVIIAPDAP